MTPERSPSNWRWLYFRKRFHGPIRAGVKTHTLRNQRIPAGAKVASPVGLLEIAAASKVTPLWVGKNRWREEGCMSEEDFFAEFQSIHPDPEILGKPMWFHEFRLVVPA